MLSLHRVSTDALILINTHTTNTDQDKCVPRVANTTLHVSWVMHGLVCYLPGTKTRDGELKTGYEVLLEIATASEEKCCSKLFERKYLINLKKAECLAYSLGSYLEYNVINHLSSELDI